MNFAQVEGCFHTNGRATDSTGEDCGIYGFMPEICGWYDDEDFTASEMCCVCGGGSSDFI